MKLLQMSCVITWAWSFLTYEVVEAVLLETKTLYLGTHFGTLTQSSIHASVPVLLTQDSPRNEVSNDFNSASIFFRGFSYLKSTLPNELSMADKQRSLRNATGLETFLSFSFIFENSTKIHKFLWKSVWSVWKMKHPTTKMGRM